MEDIRVQKLANSLLKNSIQLKENENILIEILGEDGISLGKELIK